MPSMTFPAAYELAQRLMNEGRFLEAESVYWQLLRHHPEHPPTLQLLAILYHVMGRSQAAAELLRHAIDLDPNVADYSSNLGIVLAALGERDRAIESLRRALSLRPDMAAAHNNLGNVLKSAGRHGQAIDAYRRAIEIQPDYAEAHGNLGTVLDAVGKTDEAIAEFRRAIELRADYPEAHNHLGNALQESDRLEESIPEYERALALRPQYAEAWNNLGSALKALGRLDDSMSAYHRALALRPQYPEATWSVAFILLARGDFLQGFRLLESRWNLKDREGEPMFAEPLWDGSRLDGRRILLHSEQGLGDTIQFIRYAPMVRALGGAVTMQCRPELQRLLTGQPGIDRVTAPPEQLPPCDVRCPLMSLPRIFQTTVQTIPANVPYLRPDPALVERWRRKLPEPNGRLNVGLAWAGSPRHRNDRNRSLPTAALAPLAALNVNWISLQKRAAGEPASAPPGMRWIDLSAELSDLADTAALMSHLELVISADTAPAHLAGALGKRTWIALPFAPDWRWLLDRSDSPWYPTARLFRQTRRGDWSGPVAQIVSELSALIRS